MPFHTSFTKRQFPYALDTFHNCLQFLCVIAVNILEIYSVQVIWMMPVRTVIYSMIFVIENLAFPAHLRNGTSKVFAAFKHSGSCYDQCFRL